MGCFPGSFQDGNGPLRHSGKRPIKVGKRPIQEGKRTISALMGSFRAPRHDGKRPLEEVYEIFADFCQGHAGIH